MAKAKHKKKTVRRKIVIIIIELLVLLVLAGMLYVAKMISKIEYVPMTASEAGINEDIHSETIEVLEGYTNFALFGLDNHEAGTYSQGNSDAILIASIDNNTKDIRLVSVYRDTLLNIGDGLYRKCNAAYATGGAVKAVQMLNSNLDLNITEYVTVDWGALVEVIDGIGGIDIEITEEEIEQLNLCIPEIDELTGKTTPEVTTSGKIHLDGTQATAYARIRHLEGWDFMRAARQRIVLQAMLNKAKQCDIATLTKVANNVFGHISTSMDIGQILMLAKDVTKYNLVQTSGFPFDLATMDVKEKDCIVAVELVNNVEELHKQIFAEDGYIPSETVKKISQSIVDMSGVTIGYEDIYNTDRFNDTVDKDSTSQLKKKPEE